MCVGQTQARSPGETTSCPYERRDTFPLHASGEVQTCPNTCLHIGIRQRTYEFMGGFPAGLCILTAFGGSHKHVLYVQHPFLFCIEYTAMRKRFRLDDRQMLEEE